MPDWIRPARGVAMCLTAQAFSFFLNLMAFEALTTAPDRIIVHAEVRDAHWVMVDDGWCTMAPQIDRMTRFDLANGN